jgi:hypothetical protein
MKATVILVMLTGCAVTDSPVFCTTPCGLGVAATNRTPQFACEDYMLLEALLVSASPLPTCQTLAGAVAWELPGFATQLGDIKAAGWTECYNRRFLFHTGDGLLYPDDSTQQRRAWQTAFTHEAVHLSQGCQTPPPTDPGTDLAHSNWNRAGLYGLINKVNAEAMRIGERLESAP